MKFCLITKSGPGLPLLLRLRDEGHQVAAVIMSKSCKHLYDGLVPKFDKVPDDFDVYFSDETGLSKVMEDLRKSGKKVFNGTALGDRAEEDRHFGLAMALASGIRVPYTRVFKDVNEAVDYIIKHNRKVVIKLSGRVACASSYVAQNPEAAARWLMRQQEAGYLVDAKSFIVQDFVPGHEISTEVWYSNGKPIPGSVNYTVETKKFAPGDLGPNTGCQTSIVFAAGADDLLVQETHKKVAPMFAAANESGAWDANTIVSHRSGNPFFLEWCGSRFGYNAIFCLLMLMGRTQEFGEVLYKAAAGEEVVMNLRKGYGFAIRVSIPPYPLEGSDTVSQEVEKLYEVFAKDVYVEFPDTPEDVEIFPMDVYIKNGELRCAGTDAIICEVASFGETIAEARDKALEVAQKIKCDSDIYYRAEDATERAEKVIPNLASRGIITAPGYSEQPEPEEATKKDLKGVRQMRTPRGIIKVDKLTFGDEGDEGDEGD